MFEPLHPVRLIIVFLHFLVLAAFDAPKMIPKASWSLPECHTGGLMVGSICEEFQQTHSIRSISNEFKRHSWIGLCRGQSRLAFRGAFVHVSSHGLHCSNRSCPCAFAKQVRFRHEGFPIFHHFFATLHAEHSYIIL